METLLPRDEADIANVVAAALSGDSSPLTIIGGGSRAELGRPTQAGTRLSLSALDGVTLYEPSELVLTAKAGTKMSTIHNLLRQNGQELAFEPIDHAHLFGTPEGSGTIGGLIAVNASGPRRLRAGAARDHFLGFRAINGRGEVFKSGGRVMKNVTGYDMSKLMAGAFGTLGILSEVTLKVLPKAETEATVMAVGLDDTNAVQEMTRASGTSLEVSSLAHLPAGTTLPDAIMNAGGLDGQALTCFRLEGPEVSVAERTATLIGSLKAAAAITRTLDATSSPALWSHLRDCKPFAAHRNIVWRISTAPTEGPPLIDDLKANGMAISAYYYDWAGGLIWLMLAEPDEHSSPDAAHAETIRKVVNRHGGHATLIRAPETVRATTPVFHPQPKPLADLTARIRKSFDPHLVLNRGRMREDL